MRQSPFILLASVCALAVSRSQDAGYGDVTDGHPLMTERQLLVLTNTCRMSPANYRNAYVGNYAILDSANYPAVDPLYWSLQLNSSAHDHAADMGDTCGTLQHNSCNGTPWDTRIRSYYTASSTIGENIAAGNVDPFVTMNQWIMDAPQGSTQPAADVSWCRNSGSIDFFRCDGHRFNIMAVRYKELGTGYAYGVNSAVRYHPFWVQDFGGGKPTFTNQIVSGAHFLRATGYTTFLANYWDPASKAPAEASLILDGQKYAMTLAMGTPSRGTYQVALSRASGCGTYYFVVIDGGGKTWRYPEQGGLVTTQEGSCVREYVPAESLSVRQSRIFEAPRWETIRSIVRNGAIELFIRDERHVPRLTTIVDCRGRTVLVQQWHASFAHERPDLHEGLCLRVLVNGLPPGMYLLVHRISNGFCIVEKVGIAR